jgi:predicted nucleotide-binding protein
MQKPSVFIGSSKEGVEIGRAVQTHLEEISEVTVWDQGLFTLGQSTLETLTKILDRFDFAVLFRPELNRYHILKQNEAT